MNAKILNQVQKLRHDYRNELAQRKMDCVRGYDALTPEDEERISYEINGIYYPKLRAIMSFTTLKEDLINTLGHVIFEDMKLSDWLIFKSCMESTNLN